MFARQGNIINKILKFDQQKIPSPAKTHWAKQGGRVP
jgi:hypothetical protein